MSNLELQGESTSSWMWTFQRIFSSSFLKPFSCIGILYMLVAWTGFNTILTYMIDILNDSGSTIEPDMGPMIVGGVRIIFASKCTIGWTKMHDVFKSLLPRYFLKDIYVK